MDFQIFKIFFVKFKFFLMKTPKPNQHVIECSIFRARLKMIRNF